MSTKTKFKIVKKSLKKHDFNKDLDEVSSKIKAESEKGVETPSQTNVKMEIQPNDTVIFNGKKAQVLSSWPEDDEIIILLDGMTVECTKKQVELVGKIDTMDVPMKFKNGLPVDEQLFVKCSFKGESENYNLISENLCVDFNEWNRKKGKQNVKIIKEDNSYFTVPKSDIEIEGVDGMDGYVPGVIVNSVNGEAERKCFVCAKNYTESIDDADIIPVKFYSNNGFVDGNVPKKMLKTLTV